MGETCVCQASANSIWKISGRRRCGLSVAKGVVGLHSAGEVWYLRLPWDLSIMMIICPASSSSSSKMNGGRRSSADTQLVALTDDHKVKAIHAGTWHSTVVMCLRPRYMFTSNHCSGPGCVVCSLCLCVFMITFRQDLWSSYSARCLTSPGLGQGYTTMSMARVMMHINVGDCATDGGLWWMKLN